MNLAKAIEINELHSQGYWPADNPDVKQANKLGIEALKRIQEYRERLPLKGVWILPGETED